MKLYAAFEECGLSFQMLNVHVTGDIFLKANYLLCYLLISCVVLVWVQSIVVLQYAKQPTSSLSEECRSIRQQRDILQRPMANLASRGPEH